MLVHYEAPAGAARELECVFVLPEMGTNEGCQDDEWPFASVTIGATVSVKMDSAPRTLAIALESPGGETRELTVTPQYESYEVCGSPSYVGSELVSLDDD